MLWFNLVRLAISAVSIFVLGIGALGLVLGGMVAWRTNTELWSRRDADPRAIWTVVRTTLEKNVLNLTKYVPERPDVDITLVAQPGDQTITDLSAGLGATVDGNTRAGKRQYLLTIQNNSLQQKVSAVVVLQLPYRLQSSLKVLDQSGTKEQVILAPAQMPKTITRGTGAGVQYEPGSGMTTNRSWFQASNLEAAGGKVVVLLDLDSSLGTLPSAWVGADVSYQAEGATINEPYFAPLTVAPDATVSRGHLIRGDEAKRAIAVMPKVVGFGFSGGMSAWATNPGDVAGFRL
jgi:hypothetical protein